jgi:hypothetical protein
LLIASAALVACRRDDAPRRVDQEHFDAGCLDPESDVRTRLEGDQRVLRTEPAVDLDGDGVTDPILTRNGYCGSGGCTWHVYRSNAGCARWIGTFFGDPTPRSSSRHAGLMDLEVFARGGWAELHDYQFNGSTYVRTRRRCAPRDPLPEDDFAEVHCGEWDAEDAP